MAKSSKDSEVYLELVDELEEELEDSEIRKLKTHLKDAQFGGFRAGELSRTESCRDILTDLLERKGIIGPGNYAKLKELMKRIRNERAADLISKAEEASGTRMDASKLREKFQHPFTRTTSTEDAASYENNDNKRLNNSYNMMPGAGRPYVVLVKNNISRDNKEKEKENTKILEKKNTKILDEDTAKILEEENARILEEENARILEEENARILEEENARNADAENLKKIFLAMKSNIEEATDFSKSQLIGFLKNKMLADLNVLDCSALFIILISHGDQRGIQMCREHGKANLDVFVKVEEIEDRINSKNLPQMKGKPKVIIVQACRKPRKSTTRNDGDTEGDACIAASKPLVPHVPVNADILIAHATSKLSLAYRNADEGSWFIKEFCRVVNEDSDHDHLLELLTTLNKRVAERVERAKDGILNQMPTFSSTFTKKFYLPYPSKPAQYPPT